MSEEPKLSRLRIRLKNKVIFQIFFNESRVTLFRYSSIISFHNLVATRSIKYAATILFCHDFGFH